MAARASTRISISWSGASPIEDTDTLVLTIGGYSLDLRVFKEGPDAGKIDWSTVAFVSEGEGSTKENPLLKWDHIIDSRPPSSLPDQGVFDTLDNGDVSETGIMFNPKTNENEHYIEIWRRLKLDAGAPFVVLERKLEKEGEEEAAFVGRVGTNALGLAKIGGKFFAWRDSLKGDVWQRVYQSGESSDLEALLPALPLEISTEWQQGATVSLGEGSWLVKELGKL